MNVKILIVDDEILQLHLIGKVMARFRPEYEITMTHQPQEALELLRTGCFNALMTDVKMPEMSGIDLIRQVRQLGMEELEIIILSGFDDFQYARSAISFNVLEYLLKPIDAVSLEDALCKLEAKLLQNVEKRRLQNSYTQKQQALALYKKACGMQLSEKEQKAVKEFGDRVRLILSESCTDLEAFQASLPPEACVEQLGQERALAFVPVPWGALAEVPEFPGQSAVAVGLPCSPDALPQRLRELRECAQTARWLGRKRVVQSPLDEGLLQACVQAIREQCTYNGTLYSVNLLFDAENEAFAFRNPYDGNGTAEVTAKQAVKALRIRMPGNCRGVKVEGAESWFDGEWLYLGGMEDGETVKIAYDFEEKIIATPFRGKFFTFRWNGEEVTGARCKGKRLCYFPEIEE